MAEAEFSKNECGTIKLKSVFSSAGNAALTNATEIPVAVKADCDTKNLFESGSGSFCVVAQPSVVVNGDAGQTFTLDESAALIPGPCDFSACSGSGSGSFRQASSSSGADNSSDDADSETTTPKPDEPEQKKKRKQQKSSLGQERSVNVSKM